MLSIILLAVLACPAFAQTVTFKSLLNELVDRQQQAKWSEPFYTCSQFSSYDRNSVAPDKPGWWANADRSYFLRTEEAGGHREFVLMDIDGPGAMVRFWATWHGPHGGPFSNGTLRVYLDNQATPVIAAPIASVLDEGFLTGAPLSEGVSPQTEYAQRGHNLYLPIPYARHCKVTYETSVLMDDGAHQGEALYYQINYRTYEKGTAVSSFTMDDLKTEADTLAAVQKQLASPTPPPAPAAGKELIGQLAAGQSRALTLKGGQAISQLQLQLQAANLPQALRTTVLQIAFDGNKTVWCPVGDFFGVGYQINPTQTWVNTVTADGVMTCSWLMPFQKSVEITLQNLGDQPVEIKQANISLSPWQWDDNTLYFHSAWKQWSKIISRSNSADPDQGASDLNWVTLKGRGKYMGDVATLFNNAAAWWGEGDEKVYVDGEAFPSHIGTGTEDYFGYAWCRPEAFTSPFHAQPCGAGNLKGGFSVNSRIRLLDIIPFRKSLQFDMELWHWAKTDMEYAPTVYWYGDTATSAAVVPNPTEARTVVRLEREVKRVNGANEGEKMKVVAIEGGKTQIQDGDNFNWSENGQLWWMDGAPGQTLTLEFTAKQEGRFTVAGNLTHARDYAIVAISINGAPLTENLDLYEPNVTNKEIKLGDCPIKKGVNQMKVVIKGANDQAEKRYMFGLDYLLLKNPAESK